MVFMCLAVVGADARVLCRAAGITAVVLPTLREAAGRDWDLLALTRGAAPPDGTSSAPRAHSLLLPGSCAPSLARHAEQVVCYGFSPRDTLTLSGTTRTGRMLCLQRSVVTIRGKLIEPQELPLSPALSSLADEDAMLAALLRLLCGA